MPKFMLDRDLQLFRSFARELVDTIIENTCVLFKVNLNETKINLYGEAMNKTWYPGVELFVLIDKEPENVVYEGFGPDTSQNVQFRFNRFTLKETGFYPEVGDIIFHNDGYFEIDNVTEDQLIGGRVETGDGEAFSLICSTFMTRRSSIQTEMRIL